MPISTGIGLAVSAAASAGSSIVGGVLANKGAQAQAEAAERSTAAAIAESRRQFDITQKNLAPWLQTGSEALRYLGFLMGLGPDPNQQRPAPAPGTPNIPINFESLLAAQERLDARNAGGRIPFGRTAIAPLGGIPLGETDRARSPGIPLGETAIAPSGNRFALPGGTTLNPADFGRLTRSFSLADFEKDPGFQFRLDEGQKLIERSAAARGGLVSGRTGKELTRFGQDFASEEFGRARNRFREDQTDLFNRFALLAGVGQTAAGQLADLGSRFSSQFGDLVVGGATSAAAARAAGNAALSQGLAGVGNSFMNLLLLQQALKKQ